MVLLSVFACGDDPVDFAATQERITDQWWELVGHGDSAYLYMQPDRHDDTLGDLWYSDGTPDERPHQDEFGGAWALERSDRLSVSMSHGLKYDLGSPVGEVTFNLIEDGSCYEVTVDLWGSAGTACPYTGPWR